MEVLQVNEEGKYQLVKIIKCTEKENKLCWMVDLYICVNVIEIIIQSTYNIYMLEL